MKMLDLPDGPLVQVLRHLTPLPDLFNVMCCKVRPAGHTLHLCCFLGGMHLTLCPCPAEIASIGN